MVRYRGRERLSGLVEPMDTKEVEGVGVICGDVVQGFEKARVESGGVFQFTKPRQNDVFFPETSNSVAISLSAAGIEIFEDC